MTQPGFFDRFVGIKYHHQIHVIHIHVSYRRSACPAHSFQLPVHEWYASRQWKHSLFPTKDDTAGYFARWKWFSPVSYLPADGWYWIKLISEDIDGNRSEAAYSIIVDTSATDSDSDGISDSIDWANWHF